MHALRRIRIRDPSNQTARDLRLRPYGYRDRRQQRQQQRQ